MSRRDQFGDQPRRRQSSLQDDHELQGSAQEHDNEVDSGDDDMESYHSTPVIPQRQLDENPFLDADISTESINDAGSRAMDLGESDMDNPSGTAPKRRGQARRLDFEQDDDDMNTSFEFPPSGRRGRGSLTRFLSRGKGRSISGRAPPDEPDALSNIFQASSSSSAIPTSPNLFHQPRSHETPPPGTFLEALQRETPGSPDQGRVPIFSFDTLPLWTGAGRRAVRQLKYGTYLEADEVQDAGVGTSTSAAASGPGLGRRTGLDQRPRAVPSLASDRIPSGRHMSPTLMWSTSKTHDDLGVTSMSESMENRNTWREFEREMDKELIGYQGNSFEDAQGFADIELWALEASEDGGRENCLSLTTPEELDNRSWMYEELRLNRPQRIQ